MRYSIFNHPRIHDIGSNGNNYNYLGSRLRLWCGTCVGLRAALIRCMCTYRSDDDRTIADAIGWPAQAAWLARNRLVPAADTLNACCAGCDAAWSAGQHSTGWGTTRGFGFPGVALPPSRGACTRALAGTRT